MSSLDHPRPMRGLLASEVAIKRTDLELLRRKEAAHDRYLESLEMLSAASEIMREEATKGSQFAEGWLGCLRLLHQTIANGKIESRPTSHVDNASPNPAVARPSAVPMSPLQRLTELRFLARDLLASLSGTFGPLLQAVLLVLIVWWLVSAQLSGVPGCTDPSGGLFNCP